MYSKMVWFFGISSLNCMKMKKLDCLRSFVSLRQERLKKGDRGREWDEVGGRAPECLLRVPQAVEGHNLPRGSKRKQQAGFSELPWFSLHLQHHTELILLALGQMPRWTSLSWESANQRTKLKPLCSEE